MTNPDFTAIATVVDRSGSMSAIVHEARSAINSFVNEQKKLPGKATLMHTQFDTYVSIIPSRPLEDINELPLQPRGLTALNDAIGQTIVALGEELSEMDEAERPGHVVVVIITDGFENASQEYTTKSVAELIKRQQEEYSWEFVFLAANQDAVLAANDYHIARGSALSFSTTATGLGNSSTSLNTYVASTRAGNSYSFTDDDRSAAES